MLLARPSTHSLEHASLLGRVFPGAGPGQLEAVRSVVITSHLGDRVVRLVKTLGEEAPLLVQCRLFELNGERCIGFEQVNRSS